MDKKQIELSSTMLLSIIAFSVQVLTIPFCIAVFFFRDYVVWNLKFDFFFDTTLFTISQSNPVPILELVVVLMAFVVFTSMINIHDAEVFIRNKNTRGEFQAYKDFEEYKAEQIRNCLFLYYWVYKPVGNFLHRLSV